MTAANRLPSNERRGGLAVKLGKAAPTGIQAVSWSRDLVFLAHSAPQASRFDFKCRGGIGTLAPNGSALEPGEGHMENVR